MGRERLRRCAAAGLAIGVLVVAPAPPRSFGAAPPVRITIAQGFVAPFAIGLWIAAAHGIFGRNGLDVDVSIVNSTQAMQALISGSVQVMLGSPGQGLAANAAGADVVEVATLAPRIAYRLVGRGFTKPEELRAKRLGTSAPGLSTDRAAMIVYLRSIGLNPNDNTFVTAGPPAQRLVAIVGGGIDATVIDPAQWLAADRAGLSLVADLTTLKIPWDHDVVQTTRQYVNTHRPVITALVRSLVEANAFILTPGNKPAVIRSLSRNLKIDPALTGDLELNYQLTTKLYTVRKPYPSLEAARTLIENLKGDFPDLVKVNLGAYVDRSFVRELDESGYIDRLYK
jgi:ABC-type nitrate/sulfonate/bicarbonate transport system substrate-binding protein